MANRPSRLTEDNGLLPWRRAKEMTRCFLYWLPVRTYPVPSVDRTWLHSFFDQFIPCLNKKYGLRVELFLQSKALYPHLMDEFSTTAMEYSPLIGLARRPLAGIPQMPSEEQIADLVSGRRAFDFRRDLPDYAYWLTKKNEPKQRRSFLGYGGLTMTFLAPDPATKAPPLPFSPAMRRHPIFKEFDIDALHEQTFALTDAFQKRSKELLGADIAKHPQFPGLRFIIPLVKSADFFSQPEAIVKSWFEVYPILIQESPEDQGILMAAKMNLDDDLEELLAAMDQKQREAYLGNKA